MNLRNVKSEGKMMTVVKSAKCFVSSLKGLGLLILLLSTLAEARSGAGIVLGQPTGLSFRTDTGPSRAFDAVLAWSMGESSSLFVHGDFLWLRPLSVDGLNADLYYGVGAMVYLPDSDFAAALRLPIGLSHKFRDPSLELFGELAIAFTVVPATDFDVVGGIGLRYWW